MADNMENVDSWTVSGSKEAMEELQGFAETWCTKYSTVQCNKCMPFPADFSTKIHFFHTIAMFIEMCGPPQKLSLTLVPHPNILHIIMKLTYYMLLVMNVLRKLDGWFKPPIQQALVTPH